MGVKVGLHTKQLIFFASLALICGLVYYLIVNQYIFASISDVMDVSYSQGTYNLPMFIEDNSNVIIAQTVDKKAIEPEENYDLFKYVVFSKEGIYADELHVEVKLPKAIGNIDELKPRVYAVHGVGETDYYLKDPQTIVFEAYNLVPTSTFTIELSLPKGYVSIPWTKQMVYSLTHMSLVSWIIVGLIPLAVVLVVLFYLYHKTSQDWIMPVTNEVLPNRPDELDSAEASVLVNNKINSRSIASIFIGLASRGKIKIVDHGDYFTLYRGQQNLNDLKKYERILLDKVFMPQDNKSSIEDVELRISRHVFSRKIAQVYLEIYEELYKKGYYTKNPNSFQSGYIRFGYTMFFLGILGFILNLIYVINIPYLLIIWFSLIVGAIFIVKISPKLPTKTKFGLMEARKWQAYKNFLKLDREYDYSLNVQTEYEKGLSYAVAFGCEREWTKRFVKYPFHLPNWLISSKNTVLIEDVLNEVIPFVYFISYKLTQIKEPTV